MLALMMSLLLLCGCAATEKLEERYVVWHEGFVAEVEHEISADISFSSGDKVCDYSLSYMSTSEAETIEVIEPELISRVEASIIGGEMELSFNNAVLETGCGLADGLSPLTSLPRFMDFIRGGHLENIGRETGKEGVELIVSELELADGSKMTMWQSEQSMTPVAAAIRTHKAVDAKINITNIK